MTLPEYNQQVTKAVITSGICAALFSVVTVGLAVLLITSPFAKPERFAFMCVSGAAAFCHAIVTVLLVRAMQSQQRSRSPRR